MTHRHVFPLAAKAIHYVGQKILENAKMWEVEIVCEL